MQKKGANISLKGYDDIFSTDQSRAEAQQERVQEIPLSELILLCRSNIFLICIVLCLRVPKLKVFARLI